MKEFRKKKHHYIPLIAGLVIILAAVLITPSFIPQSACEFYSENVFRRLRLPEMRYAHVNTFLCPRILLYAEEPFSLPAWYILL